MDKRLLLIVNPAAGQKKALRYLADVLQLFCARQYECTVHMTQSVGDAYTVTKRRAAEFDLLVCVGGDGTLNEVLSGLVASGASVDVGYIPAGSTNDFATSLGLSKDVLQATRDILDGDAYPLDLGCFNGRPFSYVASCGAFTKVSYSTPQASKNLLGHLAYILEGIKDVGSLRREHLRVEIDGDTVEGDYIFAAITNATSIGGVLKLDKARVSMSDGQLELLLIRYPKTLVELNRIVNSLKSQSYESPLITFRSAEAMTVFADKETQWSLDGEFGGGAEQIEIKTLHHAVQWRLRSTKEE